MSSRREAEELRRLLTGQAGGPPNPWLDTPADPQEVFRRFRAEAGDDPERMRALAEAVLELGGDPEYGWFALYYLMDFLEEPGLLGPGDDLRRVAEGTLARVRAREPELRALRRWAGATDPDGCWGVAERFARQLEACHPWAFRRGGA